jgi:hypothetical protein
VIDVSKETLEKDRGLGRSWTNDVHIGTVSAWLRLVLVLAPLAWS